jgi:hypothetical protein
MLCNASLACFFPTKKPQREHQKTTQKGHFFSNKKSTICTNEKESSRAIPNQRANASKSLHSAVVIGELPRCATTNKPKRDG